jgi:uroporphyrinogen-III synthase
MSPLDGKRILITRARHQADPLIRSIEQAGGVAVVFPTIAIVPPRSWEDCDRKLDGLYMYDGLIFTSANAVSAFLARCKERNIELAEFMKKRVFAVGEKTKEILTTAHLPVTGVPEHTTAPEIARLLDNEDLTNRAFLFPCGNLAGNELSERLRTLGASVDRAVVYDTVLPSEAEVAPLANELLRDAIDVATFMSPSAFRNFMTILGDDRGRAIAGRLTIAVIGPTTADAVRRAGFRPAIVARAATAESLVESITEFFRH